MNTCRHGEFNFSVHWSRNDELGRPVRAHAERGGRLSRYSREGGLRVTMR